MLLVLIRSASAYPQHVFSWRNKINISIFGLTYLRLFIFFFYLFIYSFFYYYFFFTSLLLITNIEWHKATALNNRTCRLVDFKKIFQIISHMRQKCLMIDSSVAALWPGPALLACCGQEIGYALLVCFEVLRPSQPNGVMSSAVSLLYHTFTGKA